AAGLPVFSGAVVSLPGCSGNDGSWGRVLVANGAGDWSDPCGLAALDIGNQNNAVSSQQHIVAKRMVVNLDLFEDQRIGTSY
ncbi:MAG: hypothetical protein ABIF77_12705, partial [bacterium]